MTENPIEFKVPGTLSDAVDTLIKNKITGMPVVDSTGRFAGVITRRDIFNNPNETQAAMVMRKAKPIHPDDSVEFAAREMIRQRRRHIIVTEEDETVCGILTPQNFLDIIRERFPNIGIGSLKLGATLPMWEKTPLSVAYYTMRYSGTFANPIIDIDGAFKGLITDRDLFNKIDIISNIRRSDSGIDMDEDPWTWGGVRNMGSYFIERNQIKLPSETVESILIRDPVVAFSNEKIGTIALKMKEGNFNHLPVLDGPSRLSGMLYDFDLMGVFDVKL
ncbi:MAG: CBS domain-containing protein [Thermoplasmataceae archaeon]